MEKNCLNRLENGMNLTKDVIAEKDHWYLLELDEEGNPVIESDQMLRIPTNSYLKIRFYNGSKISLGIKLITNAADKTITLDRIKNEEYFDRLEKKEPSSIDSHVHFDLQLTKSGPIFILFAYQDESNINQINQTKEFYIIVEPSIEIGKNTITLDSMHIQTVLSKSLGKLSSWENFYKEAHLLKYNFIHFTPIQQLGASESLYCISNNNAINDFFFDEENLQQENKLKILHSTMNDLKEKYHIGGIIDIVLNHAASNSEWLLKNPQSGFNLMNFPHLNCAYALEKILLNYSQRYAEKKVSCSSAPYLNNENDLKDLINELSREVNKNNLDEYFLIAIDIYIPEFTKMYAEFKEDFKTYLSKKNYLTKRLKEIQRLNTKLNEKDIFELIYESCSNYGVERYGVILNTEFVSILVLNSMNERPSENDFLKEIKYYLNKINDCWYKKSKEFIAAALDNIRSYVKYEFLDLKRSKVTLQKRIVENYFIAFDTNRKDSIFACNGWLFGVTDPTINFALYGNWHYFTRSIVIWGDCPKLNYGEKPEDSPYLWEHMTKYVQDMARIFNGFRLDNAHSTPIYVAEYLMKKAREVNEDLIIIAELFAGTKEREINFVNRIGINHLIREAIYCTDAQQLSEKIHNFGGGFEHILGKLNDSIKEYRLVEVDDTKKFKSFSYKYLTSAKPRSLMFEITHDNPSYYEKFNNLGLNLTFLVTVGMCYTSIGTTRGFDQLFPYQPSVVKESRQYLIDQDFKNILENFNEETEESGKKENNNNNNNKVEHTFEFNLNNSHNNTNSVRLALSSNNWDPRILLKKINDKKFSVTLSLIKDIHYYKFVLDNNIWVHDSNADVVKDATGNLNNILDLKQDSKFILPDLKLVRREINKIRNDLMSKEENQIFVHQDRDLLCIFRMFVDMSSDYNGYVLICRTGFERQSNMMKAKVELPGEISEFIFSATIQVPKFDINIIRSDYKLVGVKSDLHFSRDMKSLTSIATLTNVNNHCVIDFHSLLPNTVIALKIKLSTKVKHSMATIYQSLSSLDEVGEDLIKSVDICDINHALYKCEKEELDNTSNKRGNYEIANYGKLVYAGMTHLMQLIVTLKKKQSLDSPIFNNIREGDWLIEYQINRLKDAEKLKALSEFINEKIVQNYKSLVNYLKPHFFCLIFDSIYDVFVRKILNNMLANNSNEIKIVFYDELLNSEFVKNLLCSNLQFTGYVESAKFITGDRLSISAGLPHFSIEYMRCWGRDTFISFKGLLLVPGFYSEAKLIIKHFASTVRHGLIPNLLDCGNNPRYNARDAVWFFLQAIKDYLIFTGDYSLLTDEVNMLFLDDEISTHYSLLKQDHKKIMKLRDVIQHIIESHSKGIEFREWRAGKSIDEHMKDEGFNIKIYLDATTGFIYGGNKFNCGTWMDKMGSSEKAKNKGNPATPRDGANVEIQGLLYSVLNCLVHLHNINIYPYNSAKLKDGSSLNFYEWGLLLENNFEKYFYITSKPTNNISSKQNYYKDYLSHSGDYNVSNNYQLRPNYLIAMAVAPKLFSSDKATKALLCAEKYLLVNNGLGIRTLDQEDKLYNGNYINNDDSVNYYSAHGFNYHNGPEWLWPFGFYLMSKLNFNSFSERITLSKYIYSKLNPHMKYIKEDKWKGLPELMNKDNSICPGSCNTQAWSIATIVEALYEMNKKIIDFKEIITND